MGMTMIEKILARASGSDRVRPGDIVTCQVDRAVQLDLSWASPGLPIPEKVWDPSRIAVILDHAIPAPNVAMANGLKRVREFAKRFNIKHFYPEGRHGIGHQVVAELGLALPGTILACSDSHTCASGAFNCAARGIGSTEMLYVLCKGQTWYEVVPTVQYVLKGRLGEGVYARDIVHYIAGVYGEHLNLNLEFVGPAVKDLDIASRQTITTMAAELSAEFALFECDERTEAYLRERTSEPYTPVFADPDAEFYDVREIDLGEIEPQVVMPHFVPHNVRPVSEVAGLPIDQAFIGSCANGRIEDLRIAAEILKGRSVHPDTRLIITPASTEIAKQAVREGLVEIFLEAGAIFTNPTCGACYGGHMGIVGDGERCLTSSTRNFKGRMGSPNSEVLMASPATVAASAVVGAVADPRRPLIPIRRAS
ncbi:MAG TPA: aconitase/3-isopropylmalate dehydratase large subunit family protein [Bacillota bacterium]